MLPALLCFEPCLDRFTSLHRQLRFRYRMVWVPTYQRLTEALHTFGPQLALAIVSAGDGVSEARLVANQLERVGVPSVAICVPLSEESLSVRHTVPGPLNVAAVAEALATVGEPASSL